jgi:hypothetical protein
VQRPGVASTLDRAEWVDPGRADVAARRLPGEPPEPIRCQDVAGEAERAGLVQRVVDDRPAPKAADGPAGTRPLPSMPDGRAKVTRSRAPR